MQENAVQLMKQRWRNQVANLVTSGTVLACIALGILLGSVSGIHIAHAISSLLGWGESARALIVIFVTLAGFGSGLLAAYSLSPCLVRFAFSARPSLHPTGAEVLTQIKATRPHLSIHLYEIDDEKFPVFGSNVVVAGFTLGKGFLSPSIFASKNVLQRCPRDELHAIFAHEIAHLSEWHLLKRIQGALGTFLAATFFTSLLVVGMHWSGYVQVATLTAAISGMIPAVLTWIQARIQMREQEKEADLTAIETYGAEAGALLAALERLTACSGHAPHPLVVERMDLLKKIILTEPVREKERIAA